MSPFEIWTKWKGKAVNSFRTRGVAGTVKRVPVVAKALFYHLWIHYLWYPWFNYKSQRFDRRFAVNTAGWIFLPELQTDPQFKYSNEYMPTPPSEFFAMLQQINVDYSKFAFIDFGCGKGKALLLASELPFQKIIGIELSTELIRVAKNNWKTYLGKRRCETLQLYCVDASEYQIPPERAIFFFANPFGAEVMNKVLGNIRSSLAAAPREIYIVYLNPVLRELLDESSLLEPVKLTSWYAIYQTSGT